MKIRSGIKFATILTGICVDLFLPLTSIHPAYGAEPKLYTAYNIWTGGDYSIEYINFKSRPEFIPAGTEIKSLRHQTSIGIGVDVDDPKSISFTRTDNNKSYRLFFEERYHPGKSPDEYKNLTLTTKNYAELTNGFTECEQSAIKKGKVVDGMRREAVLVSYGYPPEHSTGNLSEKTWTYYIKRTRKQLVKFDDNGLTYNTEGDFSCKQVASAISNSTPVTQTTNPNDIKERIKVLNELKSQGVISSEEYDAKRKELLSQL